MMDTFVVFFDVERPVSHFGWDGAFCGATPAGELTDRHGWDDVQPCPACVKRIPLGTRHIYRTADGIEALCGVLRDSEKPITAGIDDSDPELCDRCLTITSWGYRILDAGARVSLLRPQAFRPRPIAIPAP